MGRRTKQQRVLEGVKSLMILLLTCSALYLMAQAQLSEHFGTLLADRPSNGGAAVTPEGRRAEAARPMRMAACLGTGGEVGRYGVQYDAQAVDELYAQAANLLGEALSSAGAPREVTQREWRSALVSAPGLYFDLQGQVPMSVLTGWLLGEQTSVTGTVRRLMLSGADGQVKLYYCDERDGRYYAFLTQVVSVSHLEEALSGLSDNGAFFAFESDQYEALNPYTLLLSGTDNPKVYACGNPLEEGDNSLRMQEVLSFPQNSSVSYNSALGEQVVRNGNDTLRISAAGALTYSQAEGGSDRYLVPGGAHATVYQAVEACRQLAQDTLGRLCGEARLYLLDVQETDGGWQMDFGYSLNGLQVRLGSEGYAARFTVEKGQISQYTLRFRSYTDTGETSVVLPERQAMAAMTAMGHRGEELLLVYLDGGAGETLSAGWAAAGASQGIQAGR